MINQQKLIVTDKISLFAEHGEQVCGVMYFRDLIHYTLSPTSPKVLAPPDFKINKSTTCIYYAYSLMLGELFGFELEKKNMSQSLSYNCIIRVGASHCVSEHTQHK